ncbi:MAG: polyphosphate polymerase domain-containing protein [Bacteroidota bacterium]|nr:polyphosphate polymerase domain-containing protein [Bacteroidota bacterium]
MRIEYKYLIRKEEKDRFFKSVTPYLVPDGLAETNGGGWYTVRSIYYDTTDLRFYREKIEGLPVRKKIRVRVYNERSERSIAFLEIKRKDREAISKNRAPVAFANVEALLATGDIESYVLRLRRFPTADEHARRFLYHMYSCNLQNIALVTYERQAFHGSFDHGLRLTFDYNLRCRLHPRLDDIFSEDDFTPYLEPYCVIEIKSVRGIPFWLADCLGAFGLIRQTVSKYCIGVQACGVREALMPL